MKNSLWISLWNLILADNILIGREVQIASQSKALQFQPKTILINLNNRRLISYGIAET